MVAKSVDMDAPVINQDINAAHRRVGVVDNARNGGGHFRRDGEAPPEYDPDPQDDHHVGTGKALWNLWNEICTDLRGFFKRISSGVAWMADTAAESWRRSGETPVRRLFLLLRVVIMATWAVFNILFTINNAPSEETAPSWHYTDDLGWFIYNMTAALVLLFPGDTTTEYPGKMMYIILLGLSLRFWNERFIPHDIPQDYYGLDPNKLYA